MPAAKTVRVKRCQAFTSKNKPCKNKAGPGMSLCSAHFEHWMDRDSGWDKTPKEWREFYQTSVYPSISYFPKRFGKSYNRFFDSSQPIGWIIAGMEGESQWLLPTRNTPLYWTRCMSFFKWRRSLEAHIPHPGELIAALVPKTYHVIKG